MFASAYETASRLATGSVVVPGAARTTGSSNPHFPATTNSGRPFTSSKIRAMYSLWMPLDSSSRPLIPQGTR